MGAGTSSEEQRKTVYARSDDSVEEFDSDTSCIQFSQTIVLVSLGQSYNECCVEKTSQEHQRSVYSITFQRSSRTQNMLFVHTKHTVLH